MTVRDHPIVSALRTIVGARHVLTGAAERRRFETGYRFGGGSAVAVVRPGTLVEQWRILLACTGADLIVIVQATNTGLTGGSTPHGDYDRDVVIVSTQRLAGFHLLDGGRQVVCLPGTTLYALEDALRPLGREPHSVIGSSCIGASVVGGICNNSGGALVRRGPAYTEYALYARVGTDGVVRLCNHLGIALGDDPEEVLARVEAGGFPPDAIEHGAAASDHRYHTHVRDVDAASPARFNADPGRLFEAAGSAGRLMVFAVRVDTFAQPAETATFYIGSNDPAELTAVRRRLLSDMSELPISGEYMHRDAFDVAERYGKDVFLAVRHLGTARLPRMFAVKGWIDGVARRTRLLPDTLADRALQAASRLFPSHLPARMLAWRDAYAHHLIVKVADAGVAEARAILADMFPSTTGAMFECTPDEAVKAFLHRFAAAGAAVRYREIHPDTVEDIVALDVALRRNDDDWFERLPDNIAKPVVKALYYGHFLCHVFHQDYIVAKGTDPIALEHRMWALLDSRGAEYPAEHNVGHLYPAKPALADHYRALDPGNRLNPGIGQTSRVREWA